MTQLPPHVTMKNIVSDENFRIDYFMVKENNGNIAFTFTERTNRKVEGLGFSGKTLIDLGFDIFSFKNSIDIWYENVQQVHVDAVNQELERSDRCYQARVGYGSSMGAYAAIRFSQALSLDRVFALSPLYDIKASWERRWSDDAANVHAEHMMHAGYIRQSCKYFIAFDPKDQDVRHVEAYKSIINGSDINLIKTRYSGHPSGYFLKQVGALDYLVKSILVKGDMMPEDMSCFRNKHHSFHYLFWLANKCIERKKWNYALSINSMAVANDPSHAEAYMQRCKILARIGKEKEAISAGKKAIELRPTHKHYQSYVATLESAR
jgi:tetratricopeptide (TPR) repeat protein